MGRKYKIYDQGRMCFVTDAVVGVTETLNLLASAKEGCFVSPRAGGTSVRTHKAALHARASRGMKIIDNGA